MASASLPVRAIYRKEREFTWSGGRNKAGLTEKSGNSLLTNPLFVDKEGMEKVYRNRV
jgi:hypothetical protein